MKSMRSQILLVAALALACAGQSTGVIVTSCEACHQQATCHTSVQSITCVCKDSFSGDGLTCSPEPPGTLPIDDSLHHSQRRRRFALPKSNTNMAHVRFNCGPYQCPDGKDCIAINGFQKCADPCQNYKVLNDAWRASNYPSTSVDKHCDRDMAWDGWYRMMIGNMSASMPQTCVEPFMCGTQAPLWLASPHPQLIDEVAQRSVCASFEGSCCWVQSPPIHVKACPGNYYVYKFVMPTGCFFAYCAEKPTLPEPELVCGPTVIQVGLHLAQLTAIGLDASTAHLADPSCHSHRDNNGTVFYQVERTEGTCGVVLKTNGTHAFYSNSLFVYPLHNVTSGHPVSVPFSCTYPLEGETGLSVAVRPYLEADHVAMGVGIGVRASMSLFRYSNYTEPYPAGTQVTLPLGSALHVGVSVEETEPERFVVVLEDCYATHSANPDDLMRYFLIQNKCPSDRRQVTVDESGSSLQARFSALLFLFQGDYQDIFLHCSLNLCDQRKSSCSPVCLSKRRYRSVTPSSPLKSLTVGPITWRSKEQGIWEQIKAPPLEN